MNFINIIIYLLINNRPYDRFSSNKRFIHSFEYRGDDYKS